MTALEAGEAEPGRQQRLLQRVLGVLQRTEHAVAVHLQFAAVRLDQVGERVPIASARPAGAVLPTSATSIRLSLLRIHK